MPSYVKQIPPVPFISKAQHLPNLPITQRSLPLTHLPRMRHGRTHLLQKLHRRPLCSYRIVRSNKDLKTQSILLHTKVTNLTQISSVDLTRGIPLPRLRLVHVIWEISLVLVRLDQIAYSQSIDISSGKSPCETPGTTLSTQLRCGVCILGIFIIVLLKRETALICISLRKAYPIHSFRTRNNHFLDPKLASRLDDAVRTHHITLKAFVIWHQHITRIGGEMDDGVWGMNS